MLKVHTTRDLENVCEGLRRLFIGHDRADGHVQGNAFRLNPRPSRRGVPVTLYGRIEADLQGTLISAWPFPHWLMILWFPLWVLLGIWLVQSSMWFIALGFLAGVVSFVLEVRRGYDLLREILTV